MGLANPPPIRHVGTTLSCGVSAQAGENEVFAEHETKDGLIWASLPPITTPTQSENASLFQPRIPRPERQEAKQAGCLSFTLQRPHTYPLGF